MLAAIERATRQARRAHAPADARGRGRPARDAVQGHHHRDVLGSQDLEFFERLVASYAEEHGKEPREIAAALAYLAQKDRPLKPPPRPSGAADKIRAASRAAIREATNAAASARLAPTRRAPTPADGRAATTPVRRAATFAIASRSATSTACSPATSSARSRTRPASTPCTSAVSTSSTAHSTVGLPDGMPNDVHQRLRKAWVCGQQLSISVDSGGDAPKRPPPGMKAKRKNPDQKRGAAP